MATLLPVATVAMHMRLEAYEDHQRLLEALITAAKAVAEREMNRPLDGPAEYVEYHTALAIRGQGVIYVDHPPILANTAPVVYDDWRYSARLIASTDIIRNTDDGGFNYLQGKLQLWNNETYFDQQQLNVKVTYWGGWTETTLPKDLQLAWIELVAFWFENPDRIGVTSMGDGSYTVAWTEGEVPPALLAVFHSYYVGSRWMR